ncbi:MAG: DUF2786 domain-containing protein [Treponema sp.]|jgi:hypothetical protein|nr:DUF2786 domain-containing protein [Treponema sp.]
MTDGKGNLEAVKRRIKKLLALSKSPNENEAMAALAKARELMGERRLGESECLYTRHTVKATKRPSKWRSVLANAVAPLYYCETFRGEYHGELYFYGDSFDAFMAGEMYRYLSRTIEGMSKRNIRKGASLKYRDKYRLGMACRIAFRIEETGRSASWGPERETKMLAVKKALENEVTLTTEKMKLGAGNAAFRRGVQAGNGISLNRQATGHGGRYLEAHNESYQE